MSEISDDAFWGEDLPRWPFRLALLVGVELFGIFFALVHRGSGRSASYDLAVAMAPSLLVSLPIGFVARRWGQAWWTPARLCAVTLACSCAGLLASQFADLREQWAPSTRAHTFVTMPERVGTWHQLDDSASVLASDEQVEPLRERDQPPADVTSRVFTTHGDRHVAQLILITPDPRGHLHKELLRSRAGVVRDLLAGAGATRPQFEAVRSTLGGRFGCGHSVTRGSDRTVTCAWAVQSLAGVVVFFAENGPSLSWASTEARAFRQAVERPAP